ncbi:MAG: UPF0158 family protein [Parachlamydiales bacterium]|nr:UPF0158 family protein [Parachlamydiales bacterium]
MAKFPVAQLPLILRFHRLMDAFAKSNDERDFYLDLVEGFLIFVDLDKGVEELTILEQDLDVNMERYALVPKMTFFEIKKFMEGFVHEKVYDIDTKEKLLDIISSKDPRENFLEFIYDNLTELEKWQTYYQERSRIRIIEWLRSLHLQFVFEEDLDLNRHIIEKLKRTLFEEKVSKDISQSRNILFSKAKTYYSVDALNPRPKRGRPPKQAQKTAEEPQLTIDIYTQVPKSVRPFLYVPEIVNASSVTFSGRFDTEEQLLASLRGTTRIKVDEKLEALSLRLESLEELSKRFGRGEVVPSFEPIFKPTIKQPTKMMAPEGKGSKIGTAVGEILPKKPKAQEEEFAGRKKKKFAIKKVVAIKSSKKKKK